MIDTYEYRKWRREGLRASSAYALATRGDAPFSFDENGPKARFEKDGFTVVVSYDYDQCDYGDYLGEFTDQWSEGVVENPRANWQTVEGWNGRLERRAHWDRYAKWFLPQITEEEHYRDLLGCKIGKARARQLAREYVERDLERALDYVAYVVTVRVYAEGVELGGASLGGCDVEHEDDLVWLTDDYGLVDEAIEEAKSNLEKLTDFHVDNVVVPRLRGET